MTGSSVAVTGVLAHGVGGRQALPLPFGLVLRGAAVALLASFLALGMLWRTPRLRGRAAGRPLPYALGRTIDSRWLAVLLRACGLVATGYVAVAAVFGRDDALNPTPYAVYVLFWVGIVPASLLLGPIWRAVNPLRTIHRGIAWLLRIDPQRGLAPMPRWLGYWPAAVSLLSFVWMELAAPGGSTVPVLRLYFGVYGLVHLVAACCFGRRWFAVGDGFEVYSTLIARLCPFGRREDGRLVARNPLDGVATFAAAPGIVGLIAVCLGSTAFDSLSGAPAWVRVTQGLGIPTAATATLGLVAMVCVVAVSYGGATLLAGKRARYGRAAVPGALAHTIVPIIVGYVIAHYFSFLIFQGQQAIILLSDPLGTGANLFGTATRGVDYTLLPQSATALVEVIAIVGGHIVGVVSAHDRAVALLPRRQAIMGQLPLLVLMIGYTVGGLVLLFAG